jgi:hypothetical protein
MRGEKGKYPRTSSTVLKAKNIHVEYPKTGQIQGHLRHEKKRHFVTALEVTSEFVPVRN